MSDTDPLAAIQPPVDDGGAGAPPAPEPPTPPADDPVAPPTDDGADNKLSPEDRAEADEWDKAAEDIFPGLKSANDKSGEDDKNGANNAGKEDEAGKTPKAGDKGDQPPKPDGEGAAKDDTPTDDGSDENAEEDEPLEPADASARLSAREEQAQVNAVKSDIREKMFGDQPTELRASDGDVLDSVEKVMEYQNPATGEKFTRDEATLWLAKAERDLQKHLENINAQVDQVADVQFALKDEADVVNWQYGELLKAMPELRQKLWAEYEKTLDKDPKSGIITKAKVSLRNFYETALEPYAEMGRRLEAQEQQKVADDAKAEADKKAADEAAKQQRRQDRSDIYGPGKVDTSTEEDKEWGAAAQAVFGDQLKR